MAWMFLEIGVALGLGILIVWFTLPKKKKPKSTERGDS